MITYLLVFLAGAAPGFEVLVAVPFGILRGMNPVAAVLTGFAGNALTILLEIMIFQKLKEWWESRKKTDVKTRSKRTARAERIWQRYGIPGLALLGPVLIGSHLAAFLALALGTSKSRTAFWLLISLVIWSVVFAVLTVIGVDAFFWTRQKLA
ncbi:DNA-binding protein [Sporosarcina sp. P37]|uniref:small multi-drug export protein n=1 Tax=unclassified Sporosarcina TaxID=2647733 RepID=UPI0009BD0092|nr:MULTISPECIES: small multi-drug export protein [unclassified Sporosarcina]ARD47134.1 DNA-binding protein [Sporosarcina sp. P33]ARK23699.1 DNA-binding protein [Sporosarcina sp. P37]PID17347.1 DNA-binding protein [Sporosarcina sp. P35]